MPAALQEAFDAAREGYGVDKWCLLSSHDQTAAIYRQLRRIDAEREAEARRAATKPVLHAQMQHHISQRFLAACEVRDDETGQHVARIAHLAHRLARAGMCGELFAENMLAAAPLHDIGKIGVPDAILLKPGRLTQDEMAVMRRHVEYGARILTGSGLPLLDLAAEIALSHHENWDGSGYPGALSGELIPMSGRIVAIADVFDALLSRRPYKEPWPLDKVVAFLRDQSGKRFDPNLIAVFMRHLRAMVAIRARHPEEGG